jgi:hypothetical protein
VKAVLLVVDVVLVLVEAMTVVVVVLLMLVVIARPAAENSMCRPCRRWWPRRSTVKEMMGEATSCDLTESMELTSPHPQHDSPEAAPANGCRPVLGIGVRVSPASKEESMPRQKSLLTVIRDVVQQEVRAAIQSLLGSVSPTKPAKNGRRRRRRRRGPGRPPGSKKAKVA